MYKKIEYHIIIILLYYNKKMSKPIFISIEGNIGSGKSTILEKLQEFMRDNNRIVFLKEPVDIWETIKDENTGENILQKFYKNQDKYNFKKYRLYISKNFNFQF